VVLGGGFLRHGGNAEQCAALIPKIVDGSLTLAFAHTERGSRYDLYDVETKAVRDGTGWVLDGEKGVVLHGDTADRLIVTARVGGGRRDRDGIATFIVDAGAAGVSRRGYPTQDGLRAAEISLTRVRVGPEGVLGEPGAALPLVQRVVDETIAALCAEAVGAMAAMHELTVDYLKTRRQFGREIGSFQILQHRAVDMLIAFEQARSMAMFATMMAAEENAAERHNAISAAKVQIGRSGKLIGQQSVQLHGGIGMTMEYKVGHYFKRATMIDMMFGDADHHLRELARRGASPAAA
jgi:alkylation response protein AidB-like acyl-CoA dehydrogenase